MPEMPEMPEAPLRLWEWLVLAALGLYPVAPGSAVLQLPLPLSSIASS